MAGALIESRRLNCQRQQSSRHGPTTTCSRPTTTTTTATSRVQQTQLGGQQQWQHQANKAKQDKQQHGGATTATTTARVSTAGGVVGLICLLCQLLCLLQLARGQPDVGQQLDGGQILRGLGSRLIQQLASLPDVSDRWTRVPALSLSSQQHHSHQIHRREPPGSGRPQPVAWWRRIRVGGSTNGQLRGAFERLQRRIGARNTIRVHNAFRDLAWRLLASFSMPTPIIYEIRRQHLYTPDEDEHNDLLHNKNTSKTIRTKRSPHSAASTTASSLDDNNNNNNDITPPDQHRLQELHGLQRRQEEDEAPDKERLRLRLEDLANLSRRTLFGRVVRLPALLPFRRQVQADETHSQARQIRRRNPRRPRLLRRRSRRRKEAPERQMISINGKQYYVNDEGELKEWNSSKE